MNYAETGQLIGLIVAYNDNFAKGLDNHGKAQKVAAWQELLVDYSYADCVAAVKDYFATNDNPWITPADIISRVHETQHERLQKFGGFISLNPADEFNENGDIQPGYRQKIMALHDAAKNGDITPQQYDAYKRDQLTLETLKIKPKEITP